MQEKKIFYLEIQCQDQFYAGSLRVFVEFIYDSYGQTFLATLYIYMYTERLNDIKK